MTKYIFVTGGVVSGLGKGIIVASIGRMLKSRDISVSLLKLDPYLNVDPGTMSPYQHGEVFVTADGGETDLDLGHYERFVDVNLTNLSNVTAGQIYSEVIYRERQGAYLGGTVQAVPHVTNLIKERIRLLANETGAEVIVVEVGGTVGDIEGQPFVEAIRQMRNEVGRSNTCYVHVTLLPYLGATGELKTKPTQHSVQTLRGMGIQPDVIVCRADYPVDAPVRDKISLHCDVPVGNVIGLPTLDNVYESPLVLEDEGLGRILEDSIDLPSIEPDMKLWQNVVDLAKEPGQELEIVVVGKYVDLHDSYISVREALYHAGLFHPAEHRRPLGGGRAGGGRRSRQAPGLGLRNSCARWIRRSRGGRHDRNGPVRPNEPGTVPGIVPRNAGHGDRVRRGELGLKGANSQEFDPHTQDPVIAYLPGQEDLLATGGTMRLGEYPCGLAEGSLARSAYGVGLVTERHRHRYEYNNDYRNRFEAAGLKASGVAPDGSLVEVAEVSGHPFMLGSQFHPEFASRPDRPHPLFREFIGAATKVLREGGQHSLLVKEDAEEVAATQV